MIFMGFRKQVRIQELRKAIEELKSGRILNIKLDEDLTDRLDIVLDGGRIVTVTIDKVYESYRDGRAQYRSVLNVK